MRLMLFFFFCSTVNCLGQETTDHILFFDWRTGKESTNFLSDTIPSFRYNTQFENLMKADVARDVAIAIAHADFRIIALVGASYVFPGLDGGYQTDDKGEKVFISLDDKYQSLVKDRGFKIILGTNDAVSLEKRDLQGAAFEYARKYNLALVGKLNSQK